MIEPQQYPDIEPNAMLQLKRLIQQWSLEQGFQQVGITDTDLSDHESHLHNWLRQGFAGEMHYMSAHGSKRSRPAELIPETLRILCFRLDYLPDDNAAQPVQQLDRDKQAYVARYSLGRDYHKVIRQKLKRVWKKIEQHLRESGLPDATGRVFTDSAPVLEKALAEKAGLGWIGKNTLLMNKSAGSWFFLGEIFTNLPLPLDEPTSSAHCGTCSACIDVCPTDAIVGPQQLDARKCISYLTIEHRGVIDESLRRPMGNRIFGCDDCQIYCPWNKFANHSNEDDFRPRNDLDEPELLTLFAWTEEEFLKRTEGSAIRRTGYEGWRRNIAIALGNCEYSEEIVKHLTTALESSSKLLEDHLHWAITEQLGKASIR